MMPLRVLILVNDDHFRDEAVRLFSNSLRIEAGLFSGRCDCDSYSGQFFDLIFIVELHTDRSSDNYTNALSASGRKASSVVLLTPFDTVTTSDIANPVMVYRYSAGDLPDELARLVADVVDWTEAGLRIDSHLLNDRLSEHLLHHSRSMISVISREYRYERVNNNLCRAHSLSGRELEGKLLSDVWGDDIFQGEIRPKIDACFSGEAISYRAGFDIQPGEERLYEVVFRPFRSARGIVSHVIAETYDITDIQESKEGYKRLSVELKHLESNIPVGLIRCNIRGDILYLNNASMTILEIERSDMAEGMGIADFYRDRALFSIHLDRLIRSGRLSLGRVYLKTIRGRDIACRVTGFTSFKSDGEPLYLDFSMEDITREIELERELANAERLESVGALAGGIAHDFNNILTAIYGYAELSLEDAGERGDLRNNMTKIINAVSRARSLTGQILAFSRQMEQMKVEVDLAGVLKETISFIRSQTDGEVVFRELYDDSGAIVMADPTQLFRVFLNILTNAVHAVEDSDEKIISSETKLIEGETAGREISRGIVAGSYVTVSVSDTGCGMDQEGSERIFEPYYTTRETGKGSGLGLSVVHGIVSEMGGDIVVDTLKGKGTTMTIYIPVADRSELPYRDKDPHPGKILYVSNNMHESKVLRLALEKSGFCIEQASSGSDFMRSLSGSDQYPDLIVFVDDMAHFNLVEMTSLLKDCAHSPPVIYISENNNYSREENRIPSGIVKHLLVKPVSLKEITGAIELSLLNTR